ncbi:multidrug efflux pump subunit AcrB [Azospirillum fermentarium]|uniref:efflux RND transporter permease subunit n=1 Tax=Azospirillum fermentarium TaxID=1233114 RepID=UPI002227E7D2|nr:efflux RND transporter permease subunit [Azospirillum fermentarium]MCW2246584.1 multidrug efflux pump subunit AcrB [Azospirillum fermentarium]
MFRLILEKPLVFLIGILIVCLLGVVSVLRIPVQMIPDVTPREVSVETSWPGAAPEDVERDIILEQERVLRGIPDLERMTATADFGYGSIVLKFPPAVPIADALVRVNNALAEVPSYPDNADRPRVVAESVSDDPFMYFSLERLAADGPGVQTETGWVENTLRPRLERVPGVANVRVIGGLDRQIHILLDPVKLSARRLTVGEVRDALRARNRDLSGGDRDFGKRRYFLRTIGRFADVEALNGLILREDNGTHIRLRDVGRAEMAAEEPQSMAFADGKPIILLGIAKRAGANVIGVRDAVVEAVADLNPHTLKERGLTLRLLTDDVRYVEQSVRAVVDDLALGAVLAALALFVFLRSPSATLIGAAGLPICVLAAFLILLAAGRSINVISLSGIAFAIGMTVDNSVVALENISRHLAMGKSRFAAALDGVGEVWPAILSSTLTTVMVFIPVLFLEMEAGQLYSDIAVAIAGSIVMSMMVAVIVVPMAANRWLAPPSPAQRARGDGWFTRLTVRAVRWSVGGLGRQLAILAATLAATAAVLLTMIPAAEYLPEGEEATVFGFMATPPGTNMAAMTEMWRQVDGVLTRAVNDEKGAEGIPPLSLNLSFIRPGFLRFVAVPRSREDSQALIVAMTRTMRAFPGVRAFAAKGSIFSGNGGGARAITVELSGGRSLEALYTSSLAVLDRARGLYDDVQVNSDPSPPTLALSQPVLEVHPNWERTSALGISQTELGYTLRAYADGAFADEFLLDDDKIDMMLRLDPAAGNGRHAFETLVLYTGRGEPVPVSAVAEIRETVGSSSITRVDGRRTVTLTIIPPRSVALETAIAEIRGTLLPTLRAEGVIPEGVSTRIAGAGSAFDEIRSALAGGFLLALAITYLVLVAVFGHWGFPLIIMAVVPLGVGGGFAGLWLFNTMGAHLDLIGMAPLNQPFDVLTMLGFLILIGTSVNNPILIVEYAVENIKKRGMTAAEAVEDATRLRLRPILITTVAAIAGLAPLVLIPSPGTELYRGLGVVVMFGLLFSTLVSLIVLPVVLALVFRLPAQDGSGVAEPVEQGAAG